MRFLCFQKLLRPASHGLMGFILSQCRIFVLMVFFVAASVSWGSATVFVMQSEPHLAHASALVNAALQAAGMEAQFVYSPLGNELRNVSMISSGQTHLDMMPATPARLKLVKEGRLRMIPIPLDRGILGYRINILLTAQQEKLAGVHTQEDMRAFVLGQNEGWMDVEIYRAAGIPTKGIRNWSDGQFAAQMEAGFIDLFPLGLEETLTYFLPHFRAHYPQLGVDPHVLLRYPWFRFVWVSVGEETDELYTALQRGFDIIAQNGVFLEVWKRYRTEPQKEFFVTRRIIQIPNPFYGNDLVPTRYQHLLFTPEKP